MLKWLVTRGPSSPSSLEKDVTDDPLATIGRRNKKSDPIYAVTRVNPIFKDDAKRVSTATIETGDENHGRPKHTKEMPESPSTDRESVQSSGYGSKEADSVSYKSDSQEEDDDFGINEISKIKNHSVQRQRDSTNGFPITNFESPGSVSELRRSFENLAISSDNSKSFLIQKSHQVEIVHQDTDFVKSIEIGCQGFKPAGSLTAIPEVSESAENSPSKSSWPRVSQLAQTLQRQADRIHQRRERERLKNTGKENRSFAVENGSKHSVMRFNPLVSVVAQDNRYVTAISVSPKGKQSSENNVGVSYGRDSINTSEHFGTFQANKALINNVNTMDAVQPAYFQQSHSINEVPLLSFQPDSLITEETLYMMNSPDFHQSLCPEDNCIYEISPNEMPDFGRAIYSGFYSSSKSCSSSSQESVSGRSRTSINSSNRTWAKKKGVSVVQDLWEKSGLKTNGRKLLVDVNELIDQNKESVARKYSYGSAEEYRSLHSTVGHGSSQYRIHGGNTDQSASNRSSNTYEEVYGFPHHSSGAYEDISVGEGGIDNPVFINDGGHSSYTTPLSLHSKSAFHFQLSLTSFQKRVSENVQSEPIHKESWLDVEKGHTGDSLKDSSSEGNYSTSGLLKSKNAGKGTRKSKIAPGKAVREFGLAEGDWKGNQLRGHSEMNGGHPSWTSQQFQRNLGNIPENFGYQNRLQFWETQYGQNSLDGNISGIFSPHPNSAALTCGVDGLPCQDFTLDAKRSHRISQKSSKSEKRKRCCSFVVVFAAFFIFVGVIVGVSWYYTGGQRLFGPM